MWSICVVPSGVGSLTFGIRRYTEQQEPALSEQTGDTQSVRQSRIRTALSPEDEGSGAERLWVPIRKTDG